MCETLFTSLTCHVSRVTCHVLRHALILVVLLSPHLAAARSLPQDEDPRQQAANLAARLTPQEKVGQLVVITFSGASDAARLQIAEIVTAYHVGGVVLRRENNNFVEAPDTTSSLLALINQLQQAELDDSSIPRVIEPESGTSATPAYIPLLIGLEQPGDDLPNSTIASGVTIFPSAMAIGATWDTELARQIGEQAGQELNRLGVNLLMGPDLDVLETPAPDAPGDLGSRAFGGDPYWVGEMGKAYVAGLHTGSQGQLAVFARHFPGLGSSNRRADDEVPTVRRTLDELKQVELFPFFAVTGSSPNSPSVADGVITAHIRFQGLQGNIRATTRPVSFDPQALQLLTQQTPMAEWRASGGVLMSESLGVPAVRRFYGDAYNGRLVARDALLAGNDLLYLSRFQEPEDADPFAAIRATLNFFAQKYQEDPAFALRVDEALLRVLQLKYRLYPGFAPDLVLKSPDAVADFVEAQAGVFSVAQEAATLISPRSAAELDDRLPDAPQFGESMTFITDTRIYSQCSDCEAQAPMAADALQQAITRLYGTEPGSGQIRVEDLQSFSYQDLQEFLDGTAIPLETEEGTPRGPIPIVAALNRSTWVIFSQLDLNPDVPWSGALKRLLAERPDLLRDKKVVVFAFGAPYYLDSTEITNLSAYLGMYSKAPAFVDLAARLLFKEASAPGASPVSILGAGYDLFTITEPDPGRVIPLVQDLPEPPEGATPGAPAGLVLGDQVNLRAGPVLDRNGHVVPDGTVVRFSEIRSVPPATIEQTTIGGIARASFRLERVGPHEFRASTETGAVSGTLLIDVPPEGSTFFTEVAPPTVAPSATPRPSETLPPAPTETPTAPAMATPLPPSAAPPRVTFGDLLLALTGSGGMAFVGFRLGRTVASRVHAQNRLALAAVIGALAGYNYMALGLPGAGLLMKMPAGLGTLLVTLIGGALALVLGVLWFRRQRLPN